MSLNAPIGQTRTVGAMDSSTDIEPLWGLAEVCAFIGKSRNAVRDLIDSEPDVPLPVIGGRQPRWLAEQWTAWARKRATAPRRRPSSGAKGRQTRV